VRIISRHLAGRLSGSVFSPPVVVVIALHYGNDRGTNYMSTIAPPSELQRTDRVPRWAHDLISAGFRIETLDAGTLLTIRTRQSEYRLTVLDAERREVLVRGGLWVPEATQAHLEGSTAGGSALKIGWLGIGLRMELSIGHGTITTSRIQSISIEPPCGSRGVPLRNSGAGSPYLRPIRTPATDGNGRSAPGGSNADRAL
jgi:hypothetical protein